MVLPHNTSSLNSLLTNYLNVGSEEEKRKNVESLSSQIVTFIETQFSENINADSFNFSVGDLQFNAGPLSKTFIVKAIKAAVADLHPDYTLVTDGFFHLAKIKTSALECDFEAHRINSSR